MIFPSTCNLPLCTSVFLLASKSSKNEKKKEKISNATENLVFILMLTSDCINNLR